MIEGYATPDPLVLVLARARRLGNCLLIPGDAAPTQRCAYRLVFDPIPAGQYLTLACGRPSCANPWHFKLKRNGIRTGVSHCIRGHPYSEGSYYAQPNGRGGIAKVCKTCAKEARNRYRTRPRAERLALAAATDRAVSSGLRLADPLASLSRVSPVATASDRARAESPPGSVVAD
jgi:hypothetical protein